MRKEQLKNKLIKNSRFQYRKKESPAENYLRFQKLLVLKNGVEFLRSSNESIKPIIYLVNTPVLGIDLIKAENILNDINKEIFENLILIVKTASDLYNLYKHFIELYEMVKLQNAEYKKGSEEFFAIVNIRKLVIRDLKKADLDYSLTYYKGTLLNFQKGISVPVEYENLDSKTKQVLINLYQVRKRCNSKLLDDLESMKELVFFRERESRFYTFKGSISDLYEIAFALFNENRIEVVGKKDATFKSFVQDFFRFLKTDFNKIDKIKAELYQKKINDNLFLSNSKRKLLTFLESTEIEYNIFKNN